MEWVKFTENPFIWPLIYLLYTGQVYINIHDLQIKKIIYDQKFYKKTENIFNNLLVNLTINLSNDQCQKNIQNKFLYICISNYFWEEEKSMYCVVYTTVLANTQRTHTK